ncbi:histidine phosphatase family protein [Bradyrhizobium sp. NP1]|jgi:broad specificity phosphatase PhoE|uniref:histidine phosphatase family protein n=1 Tax=Bradyrhizobium sp. NP1 TaxID=3049772 RepID=UPI0025A5F978|nr:histidine phosphatase family protein [Bradyrhizobium sp. NP1]WJR80548.1 histidine phosphatase family protein [Bradyrhizobium sp. NP1]
MSAALAPSRSFICLRHGATDWNRQGRFQGRTDNPLNDDGIAQAHAAAEKLRTIALGHVVSSPLRRAVQTAEIIAGIASKTVALEHGLIELDFGSFEGKPVRELMIRHGKDSAQGLVDMLPADSERWADVASRALASVNQWLERHPQDEVLFVCHDAVMQSMAQTLTGKFFKNGHGRPFRFTRSEDAWSVVEVG